MSVETFGGHTYEDRIRLDERRKAMAEIRRVQKRNTNTAAVAPVWNAAVETMANECVDAIANLET